MVVEPTTRAYTLKLTGNENWRDLLWKTHATANRGAQAWGHLLLTLRGGLPAALACDATILPVTGAVIDKEFKRRGIAADDRAALAARMETDRDRNLKVLLSLSWLSVESPASLVPREDYAVVATGAERAEERTNKVLARFGEILDRLQIPDREGWILACEPTLSARIRDDAVWVDRSACFAELQRKFTGLNAEWAAGTFFELLGGVEDYFSLPDAETTAPAEAKDFVQKAGGWLSRNWGAGVKSDSGAIGTRLKQLAELPTEGIINRSSVEALTVLLNALGEDADGESDGETLLKRLKQTVGWKGRPSKGAMALEKFGHASSVTADLWDRTVKKLGEEAADQSAKAPAATGRPAWMDLWRKDMESKIGMPYRTAKDHIWEHGVMLDHGLRRVSAAHTWIKRAEVERRQFQEDAGKISVVPSDARAWLDAFSEDRSKTSGASGEYYIRKRAIDGWAKVVDAWADLGPDSTRKQRIAAAREVQTNLDENEKFGDIQLFAGFGDDDGEDPEACLADDAALCAWHDTAGRPNAEILRNYVAATTADQDQRRFKVPAYRHPDPLRHPVYVDFGNSRWGIAYSALKAAHDRRKVVEKTAKAKTAKTRAKLDQQMAAPPDLRHVNLSLWNGEVVNPILLRWHGKRLWRDLDLEHFGAVAGESPVTRADRLGRAIAGQPKSTVEVAEVFSQKDWNGRLQVPRDQLDRLADIVYGKAEGKRLDPDYSMLGRIEHDPRARRQWERLNWFLTTSAKLQPRGPWLDYVAALLPEAIEYKLGRSGYYLSYAANEGRKGRARLQLARLPGLRVLSLDLGHRYAAACAVWEAITHEQMAAACRQANRPEPAGTDLFVHLRRATDKLQKSGQNKGKPVIQTTIYRRIGPEHLPDGATHQAPWARLERQFLIKLQGEEAPARRATANELAEFNSFREFVGLGGSTQAPSPTGDGSFIHPRIDKLQADAVRLAQLGLRRLGDCARIAYALTATTRPISGGRSVDLNRDGRIEYLQDAMMLWQGLAASPQYNDEWALRAWQDRVKELGAADPVVFPDEISRPERKKQAAASRERMRAVAEVLADDDNSDLNRAWADEWNRRSEQWKKRLRWLRRLILPRIGKRPRTRDAAALRDWKSRVHAIRHAGGLSLRRLKTIRDLYQQLKAFRMRPEPENPRKNVPELGDESLAKFGRRILDQLERLREQRIKQLASRVVEAALGVGRMKSSAGRDRKRLREAVDKPCHAVVVENLERYRPEDSRLRRENRQLMTWAARNVRKFIVDACELYGLYFAEVSPAYTSRQDSRTGAPGIRCEDIPRSEIEAAVRRFRALQSGTKASEQLDVPPELARRIERWAKELGRIHEKRESELSARDRILVAVERHVDDLPQSLRFIRLPRRGGELFVSADARSPSANGLQADLNAAANIGIKALTDPDWPGAWWFVLVNTITGQPDSEKVKGCPVWSTTASLLAPAVFDEGTESGKPAGRTARKPKRAKTAVYAWSPLHNSTETREISSEAWLTTHDYWESVETSIADRLRAAQATPETPF